MGITLKWNKPVSKVAGDATGGDTTLLFMANEAQRLMDPYVPATQAQVLADNVEVGVKNGVGQVHYKVPYARYQFYGQGFNWSKEVHPKATGRWDLAMKSERGADLVKAVQNFIKRRG